MAELTGVRASQPLCCMGYSDPGSISELYNLFIISLYIETISLVLAQGLSENTELKFIKRSGIKKKYKCGTSRRGYK